MAPERRRTTTGDERSLRKEHWGSQLGVVLAVAGSAVGLGNFLRFPGQVAKYGGGAFMIPYFVSLLIIAIPLAWTEWALGRCGGRLGYNSPPGIYRAVGGGRTFWGLCGGLTALAPFVINMYYIFVESWCLLYALQYLGGTLAALGLGGFTLFSNVSPGLTLETSQEYANFFGTFAGASANGALFRSTAPPLLFATLLCGAANYYLVYRGVALGIERFCKAAAPFLLVCSILIIVRVATLGNPTGTEGQSFLDGLGFMWNPTREIALENGEIARTTIWSTLSNPEAWLAATAQIFFTVSICLGAISTYASYVKPNDDIALSGLTATTANEFCEVVLGGLMTIPPAIMFLGAQAAEKFDSSFSLGFVVLPNVFGLMPAGQFCGFLFFSLLFLAGITSSISLVQPSVALIHEAFRWSRGKCVALSLGVNLIGAGIVCWFTENLAAMDSFDFWIAQFAPFLFAIAQTVLVVFVWKLPNFYREIDAGAKIRIPRFLGKIVQYVSLPYLIFIFGFWCAKNLRSRVEAVASSSVSQLTLGFLAFLAVLLLIVSWFAIRRWKNEEEKDADAARTADEPNELTASVAVGGETDFNVRGNFKN